MKRRNILDAAAKCVCGDRQDDYGSPENNFATIAGMWNAYLDNPAVRLTGKDVAAMLALMKISRIRSGRHGKADNWIDLAGYAACGGEIESNEGVWTCDIPSTYPTTPMFLKPHHDEKE